MELELIGGKFVKGYLFSNNNLSLDIYCNEQCIVPGMLENLNTRILC